MELKILRYIPILRKELWNYLILYSKENANRSIVKREYLNWLGRPYRKIALFRQKNSDLKQGTRP